MPSRALLPRRREAAVSPPLHLAGRPVAVPWDGGRRSPVSVALGVRHNPKAVAGTAVDYEEIYRANRAPVLRLCRFLLSDPDEADDVSQEIFLKLFRQHQVSGDTIAWGPWLTRVTVNACRDRRRSGWWKWWRERHHEFLEAQLPGTAPTPEQEALSREKRQDVWRSFRRLSARQQEVFVLRHLEGHSTEEVAALLGVSAGSVKRHLFRAVHQLRKALRGSR